MCRGIPAASGAATTAFDQASSEHRQHAPVRLKPDTTNNGQQPPSPPEAASAGKKAGDANNGSTDYTSARSGVGVEAPT